PASPAVFDKRAGLPRTLIETPTGQGLQAALCKSASSGKPYLSQLVPLVALVREQRFAPAHAGDAFCVFSLAQSRLRRFARSLGPTTSFGDWQKAWFLPGARSQRSDPSRSLRLSTP